MNLASLIEFVGTVDTPSTFITIGNYSNSYLYSDGLNQWDDNTVAIFSNERKLYLANTYSLLNYHNDPNKENNFNKHFGFGIQC